MCTFYVILSQKLTAICAKVTGNKLQVVIFFESSARSIVCILH